MTQDEINALDLDALNVEVAKALGWRLKKAPKQPAMYTMQSADGDFIYSRNFPDYSRDIGAAWVILKYLRDNGIPFPEFPDGVLLHLDDIPAMICRAFLAVKASQ